MHSKDRSYQCNHCNKTFVSNSNLIRHLAKCKESNPVASSDSYDVREDSNEIHRLVHNDITPNKDSSEGMLYKCDQCDKSFKKKCSLGNHVQIHNKDRPHQCSLCNKAFKREINLIHHLSTVHYEDTIYQCTYCDKVFIKKENLTEHQITHSSLGRKSRHQTKTGNPIDNNKNQ